MKVVNKMQSTIYEVEQEEQGMEGPVTVPYRLVLLDEGEGVHTWELYRIEVEWEDESDLETGPQPHTASLSGFELISWGMGGCTEEGVVDFIEHTLQEVYS